MTPLARSLALLDGEAHGLQARTGTAAPEWLRPLVHTGNGALIPALRREARASTGPADPRTVGTMMMWRYADVARVGTLIYAHHRRVPRLDPASVAFLPYSSDAPTRVALRSGRFWCAADDPEHHHALADPLPTLDAVRARLVAEVEGFVGTVIDRMRAETRLGAKALWGIAASASLPAVAEHFAHAGDPDRGVEEVRALLRHAVRLQWAAPELEVLETVPKRLLAVRFGACCRSYRWVDGDGEKCTPCPLRTRDDRIARTIAEAQADGDACCG